MRDEVQSWIARKRGPVHFIGIGGVGMAGIAFHLHRRGFSVTGSDVSASGITDWLRNEGIRIYPLHAEGNLPNSCSWVVRTPAIDTKNPEWMAAEKRGVPVVPRGVVLPALLLDYPLSIAVSGTHGKTTVAAMIACMLEEAGWNPDTCIGGEVSEGDGVARRGSGKIIVAEADESDGTAALYHPDIAVLTNMDYDHMEYFSDVEELSRCLSEFAVQACRKVVACVDDKQVRAVVGKFPCVATYGMDCAADVRIAGMRCEAGNSSFDVCLPGCDPRGVKIRVPGAHNVQNASAAVAVGLELGLEWDDIVRGCEMFRPVKRRFEVVRRDDAITIISDYAHHPTEIRAVIEAARRMPAKRLRAVFQPHRYTRTRALCLDFPPAFSGVDDLILVPVYPASESPLVGGGSEDLLAAFSERGACWPVRLAKTLNQASSWVCEDHSQGDLLLVMGAGDVEELAFHVAGVIK